MALDQQQKRQAATMREKHTEQIQQTGTTDGAEIKGMPVILVTYHGRKSGEPYKLPLMRVEHEGTYAIVASIGGAPKNPAWYTSVRDRPQVSLQDGTTTKDYVAREVTGGEKALWWERAVAAYPPYADYQARTERQIPVFVLEPVA